MIARHDPVGLVSDTQRSGEEVLRAATSETLRLAGMAAERSRLRQALDAPETAAAGEDGARRDYVVRMHAIERVEDALERASLQALLVKGASLASTVYPRPWLREMGDIDLLVDPREQGRVLRALQAAGFQLRAVPHDRRHSLVALGERMLSLALGPVSSYVEVHTHLDKVVARPIPWRALVRRSRPCSDRAGLRVPCREDHALLVIVHLAAADFDHPAGWVDLALLMGAGFDWETFERRARSWCLATPSWWVLRRLTAVGGPSAPADVVARLRPSALRERMLSRAYPEAGTSEPREGWRNGWAWILRQTPLRDDTVRWLAGVARYAGLRVRDRAGRPPIAALKTGERIRPRRSDRSRPAARVEAWATLWIGAVRLALWVLPFSWVRGLVTWASRVAPPWPRSVPLEPSLIARALRGTSRAVPRVTCLVQALAAQGMLRQIGRSATLHLAARRGESGELDAHAWVECEGRVVVGGGPGDRAPLGELPWKRGGGAVLSTYGGRHV